MGDEKETMAPSESHSDGLEPDSKFLMANAAHDLKTVRFCVEFYFSFLVVSEPSFA
jgi:hypothetical protein